MKREKGITLIALIITIIVLLILAAVSIATLSGENGLLTKAGDAKTETEIEDIIERAKIDILGTQAENESGDITKEQFVKILNDYFDGVPTVQALPEDLSTLTLITKAQYGSHAIKISNIYNCTFGKGDTTPTFDTLTIGEAINTDKYGWKVPEYTVTTEKFTTGVWRLFYQDSSYTYLITDECVGSYKPSAYYSSYTSGTDVSKVGQKLNPMISSLFTSANTSTNIRATAWLTDTSNKGMWSNYKNGDAVFAIGSPTAELFAASYNNRINKSITFVLSSEQYGYKFQMGSGCLSVGDNHGIYNKSTLSNCWIASPYYGGGGSGIRQPRGNICVRPRWLFQLQRGCQRFECSSPHRLYSNICIQ